MVAVVVLAVLAVAGFFLFFDSSTKKVSADFASAVGIYPNTDVRMLGVKVGKVTSVKPSGNGVTIRMQYDSRYKVPANAAALVVSSSLVSERYIQLAPTYTGGAVLADGATIPRNRTAAPAELDQIYSALNQLSVALGPNGANKNGALSDLLKVAAANLGGNGQALGQSVTDLSNAAQTLADGREDLFGTVQHLQTFTAALAQSDSQVRSFNTLLATVSQQLAGERQDLADALTNLTSALKSVAAFIQNNQATFHDDIVKLGSVTGVLTKQQAALDEVLSVTPGAVGNLAHTYNPSSGTLDNRSDLASLTDPSSICSIFALLGSQDTDALGKLIGALPIVPTVTGGLSSTLSQTCGAVFKQLSAGGLGSAAQQLLKTLGLGTLGNLLPSTGSGPVPVIPGVTG